MVKVSYDGLNDSKKNGMVNFFTNKESESSKDLISLASNPLQTSSSLKNKNKEKENDKIDDKNAKVNEPSKIINVFTDGSCIQSSKDKKNRPAGYACVFPEYPSFNYASKLGGKEKTNNRAEYTACIMALTICEKIDPKFQKILYVYTDSELMINSLTKWLPGWKAKNWKKADGSPVKNVDLLKLLEDLLKKRIVVFKHVRAHTGKKDWQSINNDLADRLAKHAALS
jgi:ribonuclease HI